MSAAEEGRPVGSRLGPYEILGRIGAGGMGEVYRARDSRLARDVALKVLSDQFAADRQRLQRFDREARVVSALNHPNIVTVFEIGQSESMPFIAMELVEGQSLRQLLRAGGMPVRKLLDLAMQIAEGLARAHEAGVVHRDLKPDNIMVTPGGGVKILDFGLAKLTRSFLERGAEPDDGTLPLPTEPGVLIGTVRYMAPEQASGQPSEFRSDQFSLGSVLYEMATGEAAFRRENTVDTLSAILHEEPFPLGQVAPKVPTPLRWIIERCLAKDPADRYAATRDLAHDLSAIRAHLSEISGAGEAGFLIPHPRGRRSWIWPAVAIVAIAGACLVALSGSVRVPTTAGPPVFRQLTFRTGFVGSAYFAPDDATVIYNASWEGRPLEIFVQRVGSSESRSFRPSTGLFEVSRTGELALSLNNRNFQPWIDSGTLARMEMASGAAPREVMEDVEWASWSPDGREFAIVRESAGQNTLEYPIGTVLYRAGGGFITHPRVSRDGERVAFLEHPIRADDAGNVAVVDRSGRKTDLVSGLVSAFGLGWSPNGKEIWFTGSATGSNRALEAVDLSGRRRVLARVFGSMKLDDVSPSGRVLLTHDQRREHLVGLAPGETKERELSWLDYSLGRAISADGRRVLSVEGGEGAGPTYAVFLRDTDGSPAVRLGDGDAQALSPDGRWAAAIVQRPGGPKLVVYPTGAGKERVLPTDGLEVQRVDWVPDGSGLLVNANEHGHANRMYLQSIDGGPPRPLSPEGYGALRGCISPDSTRVVADGPEGKEMLFPLHGGEPVALPVSQPGGAPGGWTSDGQHLYVSLPPSPTANSTNVPTGSRRVGIVEVRTGEIVPWKTLGGDDGANAVHVTPDGRAYVYSYVHSQGDLYLVEGLR
jgi:serine/threonine protein kinase/Tol biopolymer transport system component